MSAADAPDVSPDGVVPAAVVATVPVGWETGTTPDEAAAGSLPGRAGFFPGDPVAPDCTDGVAGPLAPAAPECGEV